MRKKIIIECFHELKNSMVICGTCYDGWRKGIHCEECPFYGIKYMANVPKERTVRA